MKKFLYFIPIVVGFMLSACGGNHEPEMMFEDQSISYGQSYTIPTGKNIVWTSSNPLVASVTGNIVTAKKVGETIISSDKGTFKIIVTPTTYAFNEPYLQWGANKSQIKAYMNSISGVSIEEDNSTSLTYTGTGKVVLYKYSFENSILIDSGVGLTGDYIDAKTLYAFLIERYIPIEGDGNDQYLYFISPDEKTKVIMAMDVSDSTVVYVVLYVPLNPSRTIMSLKEKFKVFGIIPSHFTSDTFNTLKAKF